MTSSLTDQRQAQYDREEDRDKRLTQLLPTCPEWVARYLMFRNHQNRTQGRTWAKTSVWQWPTMWQTNLDAVDELDNDFNGLMKPAFTCLSLRTLLLYHKVQGLIGRNHT